MLQAAHTYVQQVSAITHTNSTGGKRDILQIKISAFTGTVYGYDFSDHNCSVRFGSNFGNKHTTVCSIHILVVFNNDIIRRHITAGCCCIYIQDPFHKYISIYCLCKTGGVLFLYLFRILYRITVYYFQELRNIISWNISNNYGVYVV